MYGTLNAPTFYLTFHTYDIQNKTTNSKNDLQFWIPSKHESKSTSTDRQVGSCSVPSFWFFWLVLPMPLHILNPLFLVGPCWLPHWHVSALSSHSATGLPMDAQIKMPTFAVVTPLHWFIMKQNLQWQKLFPIFPKTSGKYSRYKEYNEIDKTWYQNLHGAALPLVGIRVHSQRTWWGMPWDSDKMLIILSYMGVSENSGTPKHPKMIILVGKPMVVGYHHFRTTPYIRAYPKKLALLGCDRPLQYLRGISPPRSVSLNQVTSDAVRKPSSVFSLFESNIIKTYIIEAWMQMSLFLLKVNFIANIVTFGYCNVSEVSLFTTSFFRTHPQYWIRCRRKETWCTAPPPPKFMRFFL